MVGRTGTTFHTPTFRRREALCRTFGSMMRIRSWTKLLELALALCSMILGRRLCRLFLRRMLLARLRLVLGVGGVSASRTPCLNVVILVPNVPNLLLPPYMLLIALRKTGTLCLQAMPRVPHRLMSPGTCLSVPRKPTEVVPALVTVTRLPPQAHPNVFLMKKWPSPILPLLPNRGLAPMSSGKLHSLLTCMHLLFAAVPPVTLRKCALMSPRLAVLKLLSCMVPSPPFLPLARICVRNVLQLVATPMT